MYLSLLSDSIGWSERLNYMGVGVLLGVAVVFSVLALLWLILELFRICFTAKGEKSKKDEPSPAPAQSSMVSTPAPAPVAEPEPILSEDEIVAAITAALAVYLEEVGESAPSINGFRVVSFKKVGNAAHWNQN